MSVKVIIVPLGNAEKHAKVLEAGLEAARRFGAHLEVLHVKPPARELLPYTSTPGLPLSMRQTILDAAERNAGERAAAAQALFERVCEEREVAVVDAPGEAPAPTANFRICEGREAAVVGEQARLADLVVTALPRHGEQTSVLLEVMLRETGRPVLLMPRDVHAMRAERIAIGWNGSSEAASAVAAAMPLLREAAEVRVLTTAKRAGMHPNAEELCAYLGWHGVQADAQVMDLRGHSVGEALLAGAADTGADLLVIGSYSRRRLREMVMGGVTAHVLSHARIPLFMLH